MATHRERRGISNRPADRADAAGTRAHQSRPYVLIVSGPDGQPRSEGYGSVAAYRARLAGISSVDRSVSFDDLVRLLED